MIRIEAEPWAAMISHARQTYPNECCGAMLGSLDGEQKLVRIALPLENAFPGAQAARYELRPEDLLAADRAARSRQMDLIGIYHSHPDCDAYFSATDLANSWPWYSNVVVSVRGGQFHHARAFRVESGGAASTEERLSWQPS